MLRLTIADDHAIVRAGLRRLIEARAGWSIVAEAQDGPQAIAQAISHRPDVAIVDYSLPFTNGIEVTRQIKIKAPAVQVIVFTMFESELLIRELLSAGAWGHMHKSQAGLDLYSAIEAAASGYKSRDTTRVDCRTQSNAVGALTRRERHIVQLIAEGHNNKSVARVLDISFKTVEAHRANIMHKLDLASAAALVRYAIHNGIIEP